MEFYTVTRPSMSLPAACAPSAYAAAVSASPILAAAWAPMPQAHQVRAQAELVRTRVDGTTGTNGTTGFMGLGSSVDSKRSVDERGARHTGRRLGIDCL